MADHFSPQDASSLLDKLSTDDAFRYAFETDAAAALTSIGLPAHLAMCLKGHKLASKEQLKNSHDVILDALTRTLMQCIEALVLH
jgi:putative modified peptide